MKLLTTLCRSGALSKTLLVMRLTIILLLAAFMQVSAGTNAQTISFSGKNVSLEKVFKTIKKQTGYSVVCSGELLQGSRPVTVTANNIPLETFLQQALGGQSFEYSIENTTIFISRRYTAIAMPSDWQPNVSETDVYKNENPPITVRGRIINEDGHPVVASVMVKGTNRGVTSNEEGDFILTGVDAQATLVITATNIEKAEWKINGKTQLSITVKTAANSLNNVVVIGFGSQKKSNLTGSVATVDKRLLENRPVTNAVAALQGAAPGLTITRLSGQPGKEGFDAQIRGFSRSMEQIRH